MSHLVEGDIIELAAGHTVYARLPHHCIYANAFGDFDDVSETEVTVGQSRGGLDTHFLAGRYVVIATALTGGGVAMGNDRYDDGWKVTAQRLMPIDSMRKTSMSPDHPLRVSFYQSGSFTAMIREIAPLGRARATWYEDDRAGDAEARMEDA